MRRYRLVEANTGLYESDAAAKERIAKSIKRTLAPIEDKTFTLDWDKIEEKLGGTVPYKVKVAVERECGGLAFTGTKVCMLLTIASFALFALFSSSIIFAILFFKEWLFASLILGISFSMLLIFAIIHKKNIEKTGITKCIDAAKRGEIDSKEILLTVNNTALGDFLNNNRSLALYVTLIMLAIIVIISLAL